jgi:putative oxidoreductase
MHNTRVIRTISAGYALLVWVASSLQSPFLLVVRLYWGWQFMQTGWGKFHNLARVAQFFTSLGIPFPHANAALVASIEFFGGALLIIGLGSRIVGLVLSFNMLVAYITADREALSSIFSSPGKFYGADPYTFLFAALLVLIFGAGLFSMDHLIGRFTCRRNEIDLAPMTRASSNAGPINSARHA